MSKTAIILGATGLTGSHLLKKMIINDEYDTIKIFTRKRVENLPPKVIQFVGNILEIDKFKPDFTGDDVFCCIGTTAKKTPNKNLYKKIDFGIPANAAKLAKENGINTFIVVSAIGANSKSKIFYSRTKGEMEETVLSKRIKNTYILQPSIIGGERNETRIGEKIGLSVFRLIEPLMFGGLKKYKMIKGEEIAQAMINLAIIKPIDEKIISSDKIKKYSNLSI